MIIITLNHLTNHNAVSSRPLRMSPPELNSFDPGETEVTRISKLLPSLPIEFWERHSDVMGEMYYHNDSCAPFPDIFQLKFNNIYWQAYKPLNLSFELYKAFYDTRKLNDLDNSVHILAMINEVDLTLATYCQLWYENVTEPVIVETLMYKYIWLKDWGGPSPGGYSPHLITCQLPDSDQLPAPSCVSLVEKPCDRATNILSVVYNKPSKKQKFAVCVKGLDFYEVDLSHRIVEWIEALGIMGVHKVFFYALHVHPNISKVLNYYQSIGKVDVTHITLPGDEPNLPILQHQYLLNNMDQQCFNELIAYNDCFYRNLYSYDYIVPLDVDEIILPTRDQNWTGLMERVLFKATSLGNFSTFNARNVYFFNDATPEGLYNNIPSYMHMLKHTHRSNKFTDHFDYVKSFFDPNLVLTVHNHLPLEFSNDAAFSYSIHRRDAQMCHYRNGCAEELDCKLFRKDIIQDKILWRHKNKLVSRVTRVLKTLNLI